MNRTIGGERRIWALAAAGAGGVALVVLLLFHVPKTGPRPVPAAGPAPAAVALARFGGGPGDELLREQADLYDPTPLFLPTPWNVRPGALPADVVREPGEAFPGYAAEFTFSEDVARLAYPAAVAVPADPVEALAIGSPEAPFLGIGRSDREIPVPAARDAFVEIVAMGSGERVFARALQAARPPGDADWQPLEFLVAVEPAGLVGLPVLTRSSQIEQVDAFFRNYLAKVLRVGERLAPGFYRVRIGP